MRVQHLLQRRPFHTAFLTHTHTLQRGLACEDLGRSLKALPRLAGRPARSWHKKQPIPGEVLSSPSQGGSGERRCVPLVPDSRFGVWSFVQPLDTPHCEKVSPTSTLHSPDTHRRATAPTTCNMENLGSMHTAGEGLFRSCAGSLCPSLRQAPDCRTCREKEVAPTGETTAHTKKTRAPGELTWGWCSSSSWPPVPGRERAPLLRQLHRRNLPAPTWTSSSPIATTCLWCGAGAKNPSSQALSYTSFAPPLTPSLYLW